MPPTTLAAGDIVEIGADEGYLYLQYIGRHEVYGDAVLVHPAVAKPGTHVEELFRDPYLAFYPATAATRRGLARKIGHLPTSLRKIPIRLRRPGARVGTRVTTWIIEDGETETIRTSLTPDEARIPIAVIWNHELLLTRVKSGWRPEREV